MRVVSGWRFNRSRAKDVSVGGFRGAVGQVANTVTEHEQLPIPDYDHLPSGSLAHRVRSLTEEQLRQLLDYESGHANRLPVVHLLRQRLEELAAGQRPAPGDPHAAQPEQAPPPGAGSPANPAQARTVNQPLRHGTAGQTPNREIRGR